MKFEEIQSSEIKNGLLLDEKQVDYLYVCIKEASSALNLIRARLPKEHTDPPSDSYKYLKKLTEELNHCVTVIGKENDL